MAKDLRQIEVDIPVMYYDTDAAGVVHNIVYLRFIEYVRTLLALQWGMSFDTIKATGIHPVVVRTEIDYRKPAVLGDTVRVKGRLTEYSAARFEVEFEGFRATDMTLLVSCKQVLALVQMPEGKVVRLPKGFPEVAWV